MVRPERGDSLVDAAARLGIQLTPGQLAAFDHPGAAVRKGNRRVNLSSTTAMADFETRHILDSLTAAVPVLDRLHAGEGLRLIDVGSGAGMPGLPLKIAFPGLRVT